MAGDRPTLGETFLETKQPPRHGKASDFSFHCRAGTQRVEHKGRWVVRSNSLNLPIAESVVESFSNPSSHRSNFNIHNGKKNMECLIDTRGNKGKQRTLPRSTASRCCRLRTGPSVPRSVFSVNQIIADHRGDTEQDRRIFFKEVERLAPSMSPRTATSYLQISAKLLGQSEKASLDDTQKTALLALAERLLAFFGEPICMTPNTACRKMARAQMTTKDVALAAWSLGRLELNQLELMKLLTLMISGSIDCSNYYLEDNSQKKFHAHHSNNSNFPELSTSGPNSIDISNLLWACSRIQFKDTKLLLLLVDEAVRQLENFDSHSLASLFVAVGSLGLRKTNLTPDVHDTNLSLDSEHATIKSSPRHEPSSKLFSVQPYCENQHLTLSIKRCPTPTHVASTLYQKLLDFDTRRLCNFYWSCGKLQWKSNQILNRTIELLLNRIHEMTPQHISNVFWASGQLEFKHMKLLNLLSVHLLSPISNAKQQLSRERRPKPFHSKCETGKYCYESSRENFRRCQRSKALITLSLQDSQGIGNIFWALGRLMIADFALLKGLADCALHLRNQLLPQHIANIAWSCGRVGFLDPRLCVCVEEESVAKMVQFNSQNLVNVFWGLGKSGWKPQATSELFPVPPTVTTIVLTIIKKIADFGSQSVSNMLLACVYLEWNHPVIVQALIKRAQQLYLPMVCGIGNEEIQLEIDAEEELKPDLGRSKQNSKEQGEEYTWNRETEISYSATRCCNVRSCSMNTTLAITQIPERMLWTSVETRRHAPTLVDCQRDSSDDELNGNSPNSLNDVVTVDGQHLSNICWAVGSLQRDQHASSGDRDTLCHQTFRLFSVIATLLISDHVTTLTRCPVPSPKRISTPSTNHTTLQHFSLYQSPATAQLRKVPIQQLSLILWGFASVRLRHDSLFQVVTEEINRRLKDSEEVLHRCKQKMKQRQETTPTDQWIEAACNSTRSLLASTVPAICQTLWSLGRVFYRHWELTERCVRLLIMDLIMWRKINGVKEQNDTSEQQLMFMKNHQRTSELQMNIDDDVGKESEGSNILATGSWFWRNATIQNASNILWGITVTAFASDKNVEQAAFVKAGVATEIDHSTVDRKTILPEVSETPGVEKVRIIEDALVQLCLGAAEVYFTPSIRHTKLKSDKGNKGQTKLGDAVTSVIDHRDVGQMYHSMLASKYILEKRIEETNDVNHLRTQHQHGVPYNGVADGMKIFQSGSTQESSTSKVTDALRINPSSTEKLPEIERSTLIVYYNQIIEIIEWLKPQLSFSDAHISETHSKVKSSLMTLLETCTSPQANRYHEVEEHQTPPSTVSSNLLSTSDTTIADIDLNSWSPVTNKLETTTSDTIVPPHFRVQISEEDLSDQMLSCDILIRLISNDSQRVLKKVVLEVDGPWHFIRVIGANVLDELSPLSPGLYNSHRRRFRNHFYSNSMQRQKNYNNASRKNHLEKHCGASLRYSAEDDIQGFYLCLDGRTRLKQKLFEMTHDSVLINLPFYELAAATDRNQLNSYLLDRLQGVFSLFSQETDS